MQPLITIIGPSGVGKTSLVNALADTGRFATAFEGHDERPFQALAKQDARYILANQMDYLLLRAEQEQDLRHGNQPGLMDGGLDLDFHGFTRLFLDRNLLSPEDFDLCRRFYQYARTVLPPPEIIVRLKADRETVSNRLSSRKRINIANAEDTERFDKHLDEWLSTMSSTRVLELDVSTEDMQYRGSVKHILDTISDIF